MSCHPSTVCLESADKVRAPSTWIFLLCEQNNRKSASVPARTDTSSTAAWPVLGQPSSWFPFWCQHRGQELRGDRKQSHDFLWTGKHVTFNATTTLHQINIQQHKTSTLLFCLPHVPLLDAAKTSKRKTEKKKQNIHCINTWLLNKRVQVTINCPCSEMTSAELLLLKRVFLGLLKTISSDSRNWYSHTWDLFYWNSPYTSWMFVCRAFADICFANMCDAENTMRYDKRQ